MPLKVAIVGTGNVGSTLGRRLVQGGQAIVCFASRDPNSERAKKLVASIPGTCAGEIDETVAWSDAVILATPGAHDDAGIKKLAQSLGPNIKGKVLLDATNPVSEYPELEVRWTGKSGGELLAEELPGTYVFKAFNTIGVDQMEHPDGSLVTGQQLTMMIAGGPEGRDLAEQVVTGVGFKPVWVGGIRYARNLEAIAELWIHLAVPAAGTGTADHWGRNFHFQVLRKQ